MSFCKYGRIQHNAKNNFVGNQVNVTQKIDEET